MNKLFTLFAVLSIALAKGVIPLSDKLSVGDQVIDAAFTIAWQNLAHHYPQVAQASTTTTTTGGTTVIIVEPRQQYVTIAEKDYPIPYDWDYANLGAGFVIGASIAIAESATDMCVSKVATTIESTYWVVNIWFTQYQFDPQPIYVTTMTLFAIRGINAAALVNCTNFTEDATQWFDDLSNNFTAAQDAFNGNDIVEEGETDALTELQTILEVTSFVNEVTSLYTDGQMVFDKWYMGAFFDFGYFAGAFSLTALNTFIKLPDYIEFF